MPLVLFLLSLLYSIGSLSSESLPKPASNYVAPTRDLSPKLAGVDRRILPYSVYKEKQQKQAEEHQRLFNKSSWGEQDESGRRPTILYLPAFAKADPSYISDRDGDGDKAALFSSNNGNKKNSILNGNTLRSNPIRPQTNRSVPLPDSRGASPSSSTQIVHGSNIDEDGSEGGVRKSGRKLPGEGLYSAATYSTSATREPLQQYKNSVFRSKATNPLAPKNDAYEEQNNKNKLSSYGGSHHQQRPPSSAAENSLITRPSSMFQAARPSNGNRYPNPNIAQYSRIVPAPYSTLSSSPSEQNIVNSIFTQSQVRHAPPSIPGPLFNGPPPLAGSPFDLFSNLNPQMASGLLGGGGAGGQSGTGGLPAINPLQILGQGSTIEQISKIAKNLLSMGSGNQELLSAVTKALGSGPVDAGSKLTSTAVIVPESTALKAAVLPAKEAGVINTTALEETLKSLGGNVTVPDTLFSNTASTVGQEQTIGSNTTRAANNSMKFLSVLPQEQRNLLEAAIKNGELDAATLAPTLSTLLEHQSKTGMIRSENKLMEWIQQNRPRTAEKEASSVRVLAADKLPYYGKYCGSFVEDLSTGKRFNVQGAVWAVDDRRLIVSKFNFQPGSRSENITFWAGPANHTGIAQLDTQPSANGFYLRPDLVDIQAFMVQQVEKIYSKVRSPAIVAKDSSKNKTAEQEEQEGEASAEANSDKLVKNQLRMKRNLYDELYDNSKKRVTVPIHFTMPLGTQNPVQFTVNGDSSSSMRTPAPNMLENLSGATKNSTISATSVNSSMIVSNQPPTPTPTASLQITTSGTSATIYPIFSPTSPPSSSPSSAFSNEFGGDSYVGFGSSNKGEVTPLEWYAGFQPLLLTLPDDKWMKTLHWISLFDHNRKHVVASVLIPNGNAFQIPSMVQLRSLSPNGAYQVKSGPMKVLDTKTIEIDEFSLTTNGVPAWFMVGKEIMPNGNGHIVPVFNKAMKSFDCDSLRDYKNETITLRLPGTMDIKDVFWFSVFSIPKSVSLSHMYLPYNDMHLPPDLLGISTPQCLWKPKE